MKVIVNFSHPLSAEARAQLEKRIGQFEEVRVECQLDPEKPLRPQVEAMLYGLNGQPDYVVAPSLAPAAYLVGQHFDVPTIWVKREGVPSRWMLGGIEDWAE